MDSETLKIGIACYPLIGGSGILASALGVELARRGHEVHFFSYDKPVRLDLSEPNLHFHPVSVGEHELFKYPDYTLPLAVRMAEAAKEEGLDIIHAHYAVPHATAAYLAKRMAKCEGLRIVTTLHGTDTTLFGRDPNYRPAIEYALQHSDCVTTVSRSLKADTEKLFDVGHAVRVVPNFFTPSSPTQSREEMRARLGITSEFVLFHASNVRPVKRIDLLLKSLALVKHRSDVKLLILAGSSFDPYESLLDELGIRDQVMLVYNGYPIENYIEASDLGIYTSETESFCLSILESMFLGKPSVAFRVGGIPEVLDDGSCGLLHRFGDVAGMAASIDALVENPERCASMGQAAQRRATTFFTAERVVPLYEDVYRTALAAVPV